MFTDIVFACSIIMLAGLTLSVAIPFLIYIEHERRNDEKNSRDNI